MIGMALARQYTQQLIRVQSDSYTALSYLSSTSLDRSVYGHLVAEIKSLMVGREFISQKLHRTQNRVADCLAGYSRSERATTVWLGSGPPCIEELLPLDCNSIITE